MRPSSDSPGELVHTDSGVAVPLPPDHLEDTRVVPRVAVSPVEVSPVAVPVAQALVPAELSGMLLPTESVTFASSPHPIIFVHPVVRIVVVLVALTIALSWQLHPIVRGHHVTVPLLTGAARTAVLVFAGLLLLREVVTLVGRLFHYLSYRIVTTNRRVFIVRGLFGRTVTPLGNTALAGATMSQGVLGRMLGFGNVFLAGAGAIRDMRDPVRLYRECEAVAQGVDGDTWKQAIRQTQIP